MSKRWIRIALIALGILGILVIALWLTLRFSSPPPLDPQERSDPRPLPETWLEPEDEDSLQASASPAQSPSTVVAVPADHRTSFSSSGSLALHADGRPFGEESYELDVTEANTTLVSSGQFQFPAVVTTIRVAFDQRLEADEHLAPARYEAFFDAPLGFDRRVRTEIESGIAHIVTGSDERDVPLSEDAVILGTFSTYALLPVLFPLRERDGTASFDVLVLGGPPDRGAAEDELPRMSIERLPPLRIRAEGRTLTLDAYEVTSAFGRSLLLAKEREFMALLAGNEEGSLSVYRIDFFPNGFEILGDPAGVPRGYSSKVP